MLKLRVMALLLKIDCKRQRYHIVYIDLLLLTVGLDIQEELVFGRQCRVAFNVIDQLLVSVLREPIVSQTIRKGLPLEVEQVCRRCLFPCEVVLGLLSLLMNVSVSPLCDQRSVGLAVTLRDLLLVYGKPTLHDSTYEVRVVAFVNHKLKVLELAGLVAIG